MSEKLTVKELRKAIEKVDDDAWIILSVHADTTAKRVILDSSNELIVIAD